MAVSVGSRVAWTGWSLGRSTRRSTPLCLGVLVALVQLLAVDLLLIHRNCSSHRRGSHDSAKRENKIKWRSEVHNLLDRPISERVQHVLRAGLAIFKGFREARVAVADGVRTQTARVCATAVLASYTQSRSRRVSTAVDTVVVLSHLRSRARTLVGGLVSQSLMRWLVTCNLFHLRRKRASVFNAQVTSF